MGSFQGSFKCSSKGSLKGSLNKNPLRVLACVCVCVCVCFFIRVVRVFHIVELEFGIINNRIPPKSLVRTTILLYDNYCNTQCLAMALRVFGFKVWLSAIQA